MPLFRRAQPRQIPQRHHAIDQYESDQMWWDYVTDSLLFAQDLAAGRERQAVMLQLWREEQPLVQFSGAQLMQPRSTTAVVYGGASYRLTHKLTIRGGAATTVSTAEQPKAIGWGTVAVTDQRIVFVGETRTTEWRPRRIRSRGPPAQWASH